MFIHVGKEYEGAIRSILKEDGVVRMAVAFWGKGAEKLIYERDGRPTQIICNLEMGGTNPDIVEELMKMKGVRVKQDDRLHAKVVLGSSSALVGSANMSINGLNLEGPELVGWNEAGIRTTRASELSSIGTWLDGAWKGARRITSADIESARAIWMRRRRSRPLQRVAKVGAGFSLKEAKSGSLEDRAIYIAIYRTNKLSREAEGVRQSAKPSVRGGDSRAEVRIRYYGYENWVDLPKDTESEIIDIYYKKNGGVACYGAMRRVEKNNRRFIYKKRTLGGGHVALLRRIPTVAGLPFGPKQRAALAVEVQPYIERIWSAATKGDEEADAVTVLATDVKRAIDGENIQTIWK